jgi:hypothetical protein
MASSENPESVPTIVLSAGTEPPRYPALRLAASAFRLLAGIELVGGAAFWMYPATMAGLIPGLFIGFWVAIIALALWVAADFCDLTIEVVHHLPASGRG